MTFSPKPSAILFLDPKGTALEVVRASARRGYAPIALVSDPKLLHSASEPYASAIPLLKEIIPIDGWARPGAWEGSIAEVSRKYTIAGVHHTLDACAVPAAEIRARFGLPHTPPETVALALDKRALRSALREADLSSLRSYSQAEAESWKEWGASGACYFKPIRGSFSAYVRRCASLEDLAAAKRELEEGSEGDPKVLAEYIRSGGGYFLDEEIPGELMSVESLNFRGEHIALGITSRILYSRNPIVEMGSCFPYERPDAERILDFVRKAHAAIGFTDGASHVELIVDPAGRMEIVDFNPRFVGADVLQSINHAHGIRAEELLVDLAVGTRPKFAPTRRAYSCIQYVLCPPVGRFESIRLPKAEEVVFTASFIAPGTTLQSTERQLDYAGCYLTVLPTFKGAIERSLSMRGEVRINGVEHGVF